MADKKYAADFDSSEFEFFKTEYVCKYYILTHSQALIFYLFFYLLEICNLFN